MKRPMYMIKPRTITEAMGDTLISSRLGDGKDIITVIHSSSFGRGCGSYNGHKYEDNFSSRSMRVRTYKPEVTPEIEAPVSANSSRHCETRLCYYDKVKEAETSIRGRLEKPALNCN